MSEGALARRQRIRAPLRFAVPPRRTSQQGVPLRSEATASRRVAVKSSARGSPQISPITAERPAHLTPSSIAHRASLASRVSTWMRFRTGKPGGWMRPLSRIAIRSWTHSSGFSVPICASRNPAQPASRGCTANSSESVAILPCICREGGPLEERWMDLLEPCKTPPPCSAWSPSPRNLGEDEIGVRLPPPRTRKRPAATRLTTFLFYFCSYPVTRRTESILRLGAFYLRQEPDDLAHRGARALFRHREPHVRRRDLDGLVPCLLRPAR